MRRSIPLPIRSDYSHRVAFRRSNSSRFSPLLTISWLLQDFRVLSQCEQLLPGDLLITCRLCECLHTRRFLVFSLSLHYRCHRLSWAMEKKNHQERKSTLNRSKEAHFQGSNAGGRASERTNERAREREREKKKLNSNEEGGEQESTSKPTTMRSSSKMNFSTTSLSDFYIFFSPSFFARSFASQAATRDTEKNVDDVDSVRDSFSFSLSLSLFSSSSLCIRIRCYNLTASKSERERKRARKKERSIAFPSFLFFWMQWMIA